MCEMGRAALASAAPALVRSRQILEIDASGTRSKMKKPEDQNNLFLAVILSMAVLFLWQYFIASAASARAGTRRSAAEGAGAAERAACRHSCPRHTRLHRRPPPRRPRRSAIAETRDAALARAPRLTIDTPALRGSISLKGGLIDDLALKRYHETIDKKSPNVVLFSPLEAPMAYFAEYGWQATNPQDVPNGDTVWTASVDRPAVARKSRDPDVGQRPRPRLRAHHRRRRQLPVHRHRQRREQDRRPRNADALCAALSHRHAAHRRLRHPARRPDRRSRRKADRDQVRRRPEGGRRDIHRPQERLARHHRQVLGGGPHPAAGHRLQRQHEGPPRVAGGRDLYRSTTAARRHDGPGPDQQGREPPLCRRQGGQGDRGL